MENIFSHPAGAWAQGVVLSHAQCGLSVAFSLSATADKNFRAR